MWEFCGNVRGWTAVRRTTVTHHINFLGGSAAHEVETIAILLVWRALGDVKGIAIAEGDQPLDI